MFVIRLVKGLSRLTFLCLGMATIAAAWDYTAKANASETQLPFQDYLPTLIERAQAAPQVVMAFAGPASDAAMEYLGETGVWDQIGYNPTATTPDAEAKPEAFDVADVAPPSAPERSLFPRARAAQ